MLNDYRLSQRLLIGCGLLLIVFGLTYRLSSPSLFDDPNDAQYAEVAREMLESGQWISPQLNYALFLNKPPLLYWLVASAYEILGVTELAARIPGTLVTLLTLVLLYRLGRQLFDDSWIGVLAVIVYVGMPSTLLEARFVRPDTILVASIVGTLLAFDTALRSEGKRRRRALYGLQLALAAGVLTKGIVALLLPAFPIAVTLVAERRLSFLTALMAPRSWILFVALVAPWHIIVALRHVGFAWDYIVNQHFLFFIDRKLPRDSIPIPLAVFWGAFLARTFPWTLFLPLAVFQAVRQLHTQGAASSAMILPLSWAAGTLGFFSAATSRLEHYALPALPAVALLIANLFRRCTTAHSTERSFVAIHIVALVLALGALAWWFPTMLGEVEWLRDRHELASIARTFFASLAVVTALSLISLRGPLIFATAITGAILLMTPLVHRGLTAIAPANSTAPLAAVIRSTPNAGEATIVFEAPIEYQSCAGLNFYLRRRLVLLRPDGFVEPPYLLPHKDDLFIDRVQLAALWNREPVLFISDPFAPRERSVREIVPQPSFIIARVGNQWVVSNEPLVPPES